MFSTQIKMFSTQIYIYIAIFLSAAVVNNVSSKNAVSFPHILLKPPLLLDTSGYTTTYACEGKILNIICDTGMITLVRANYGRFSISICNDHGNLDWRVNCMSHHSFPIMQERCNMKPNCSVNVSSATFHDPCPGTLKYLEVQYKCGTDQATSDFSKSTPPSNATEGPMYTKLQTVTYRSVSSSFLPSLPSLPVRTSTVSPYHFYNASFTKNKDDVSVEHGMTTKTTEAVPTQLSVTTLQASTIFTTAVYSRDQYCSPTFSRGINWGWTKAGNNAEAKCPDGAAGMAKWHCKSNPVHWSSEEPDLLECHSLWLENLKERMENGDSIISVTSDMAHMSFAKPLFSEDLKTIAQLIQEALYKSVNSMENFLDTWHRYRVLRELLQSSVQTFSNVLETKQDVAWNDLPLSGKKSVVSSLLQVLDESSLLLAETSSDDGSFSLVKANVLLSLQVLKSKNAKTMFFPVFGEIASENEAMNWMNMQDRLIIPHQAIEDYAKNGMYKVVFTAFNRLHNLLKPSSAIFQPTHGHISDNITRIINSRVIGAALDRRGNLKLYQPVVITLKHLVEENVTNPVCVYWDLHTRDWSAQGCWIESTNKSYTVCLCDHLTNFAVVMDLQMDMVTPVDLHHLHMIITISCAFSVAALLLTVIILFSLSLDLSEDSTFIHRNMFLCLLISELVFLVGIKQTKHYIPCAIVAGLLQYLFLVIFSWMFFECYHQYVILIRSCNTKKEKFCWYYAAAYIIPGIITGTSAVVDPKSYGTEKYCWLQSDNYFVFSFVGPAVSIIFGGLVFLCITLCMFSHNLSMTSTLKDKDSANLQNYRAWNRRSIFFLLLLSLTWTAGILFINDESVFLAYVFSLLNSVQGVAILMLYCFQNEKVKQDFKRIFNNDICFKQKKERGPQTSEPSVINGSASQESNAQEFWRLGKEKCNSSKVNTPLDSSPAVPSQSANNETGDHMSQNMFWMSRGNLHQQPDYYSETNAVEEQDVTPSKFHTSQSPRHQDQCHHFFILSQNNGQFMDHIYETIDDEPTGLTNSTTVKSNSKNFQSCQRSPPAENYYGYHSDLSQHSSSSYGYDQQPLLVVGGQNRQNANQTSYTIPKENQIQQFIKEEKVLWEANQNVSCHTGKSSTDMSLRQKTSSPENSASLFTEKQTLQKDPLEMWEPHLPDLLQSPADNAVVLAVLDGDKVVSRIQDDALTQSHYKLTTYC